MNLRFDLLKQVFLLTFVSIFLSACGGAPADSTTTGGTDSSGNNTEVSTVAVVAGSESITANGSSSTVIRATVTNSDEEPISGVSVTFASSSGGVLSSSTAVTSATGIAQVTLTSSTLVGSTVVEANASGFSARTEPIQFVAGPAANVALRASNPTIASSGVTTLIATVTDAFGNSVAGDTVTFAATTAESGSPLFSSFTGVTAENGTASVEYTAGSGVGTDTLTATTTNSSTNSVTVSVVESGGVGGTDVASITLALGANSIVTGTTTAVIATVLDSESAPVAGVSISFTSTAGTLSSATATSNANGIAEIALTAGTLVGNATVTANGGGFIASSPISFTPGAAANVALTATASSVGVSGTSLLTAVVTDSNGNVIPGETVTFTFVTQASGNPALATISGTTDANGAITSEYTAGGTAGTDSIRAATTNNTNSSIDVVVQSASAVVNQVALTVGAESVTANGTNTVTLRALVTGADSAPLANQSVSFTATAGSLSSATATTDGNGLAQVVLTSSTNTGAVLVTAAAGGFSDSGSLDFVPGEVATVNVASSLTSVNPLQNTQLVATALDANSNVVADTQLTFSLQTVNTGSPTLSNVSVRTDSNGTASITYNAGGVVGTDTVRVTTTNAVFGDINVVVATGSSTISSIELVEIPENLTANGTSNGTVRVEVKDTDDNAVVGETVNFTASQGVLSSATAVTDANGFAEVVLTAGTVVSTSTVEASLNGFFATQNVNLLPGTPLATNSSVTANPSTIPADGVATTEVTVLIRDANNNLVADGTQITAQVTAGTIWQRFSDVPNEEEADVIARGGSATTSSGQVVYIVTADDTEGTATISIVEFPGITTTVDYGLNGTGVATTVATNIAQSFLVVGGVGANDNTSISFTVTDEGDAKVSDPDPGVDNIRVSFVTNPNGGEFLSGNDQQSTSSVTLATQDGVASVNLQAGSLPGAIELLVEVQEDGNFASPDVSSVVPQISIASGPPHTIALSVPRTDTLVSLTGFYRRAAQIIVTDRFGNAVPDGTAINLGFVDSVIHTSNTGQLTGGTLTDAAGGLNTASIIRNNAPRMIEGSDRLLITSAIESSDKARFTSDPLVISNTTVNVQTDFNGSNTGLSYVIGSSLTGAEISGAQLDDSGNIVSLTPGSASTENGLADIRLTYPANPNTILMGCYGDPTLDTRYDGGAGTARTFTVASATSGSATLVVESDLCFSPMADFVLSSNISEFGGTPGVVNTFDVTLTLTDNATEGDQVLLPFVDVSTFSFVTTDDDASITNISFAAADGGAMRTRENGTLTVRVTVTGGTADDEITLSFATVSNGLAQVTVSYP